MSPIKDQLKSRIIGNNLSEKVNNSRHLCKAQLALDCGYLGGIDVDGTLVPDLGGFYVALLEANGAELVRNDLQKGTIVPTIYQHDAMNNALDIVLYCVAICVENGVRRADCFLVVFLFCGLVVSNGLIHGHCINAVMPIVS